MGKSARIWSTSNGIGSSGTLTSSRAMVAAYSGPPETDMTPTPPPGARASFCSCRRILANVPVIALGLETFGQLRSTLLGDPACHEYVDEVRLDVAQDPGVVRDQQHATIALTREPVDPLGHDPQGVDVQAGVGLIQDREPGIQQLQLNNLVSLLLTAREALIDAPT